MCGITAYRGPSGAASRARAALERLEYRGYDSAGIAARRSDGTALHARTLEGVASLTAVLPAGDTDADTTTAAIGHTRWATHGGVSERNAHPLEDCGGRLFVVHNGIIENADPLRVELTAAGHRFATDVDTEVIVHLVEHALRPDVPLGEALAAAAERLEGSWAIVVLDTATAALPPPERGPHPRARARRPVRAGDRTSPLRKDLPMNRHFPARGRQRWRAFALLVAVAVGAVGAVALAPAPTQAATRTVVSLTFDDANADQLSTLSALNTAGMKATFYIPSGFIGAAGHMTRADLTTLKNAGHEIGGHSVNHPDLAQVSVDEAKRQICTDRKNLASWGFTVRSFAYPFASSTPDVEKAVAACGYRSGRLLGDIRSRFGCPDCAYAESTRPADAFALKALDQVDATWTLDDLKAGVTNAENNGGGWVQYTFHDVCADACSDLAIAPTLFSQFVTWLKTQQSAGTVVKTVGDVIGGTAKPLVDGPAVPAPTGSTNGIVNPSMEVGAPDCWMRGGYGTNTPAFETGSPAHTGNISSGITMTGYSDGDAKLLPQFDLGQCAPSVTPGTTYTLREWYRASGVTQFAVYLRSASGAWSYWTSSPWFAPATDWTQADWTTAAIPAGYNGISFALTIFGNGTLRTDDLQLYDAAGAPLLAPATTTAPSAATQKSTTPQGPVEVFRPTESDVTE